MAINSGYTQSNVLFEDVGIQEGLSSSTIYATVQGPYGFLWVATSNGLNRYDGHEFIVFQNDEQDTNSLSNNHVTSLWIEAGTHLWIGTQNGLNRLNLHTYEIKRYMANGQPYALSHPEVLCIYGDRAGRVWVGTENGLNVLDPNLDGFHVFQPDPGNPNALQAKAVLAVQEDAVGNIWVGTWDGGLHLIIFDPQLPGDLNQVQFVNYRHDAFDPHSLSNDRVWELHLDPEGRFWIGTFSGGLNLLIPPVWTGRDPKPASEEVQFVSFFSELGPEGLSHEMVFTMASDEQYLWVGTVHGLNRMNRSEIDPGVGLQPGKLPRSFPDFEQFYTDEERRNVIPHNEVRGLLVDHNDNLWVSTFGGLGFVEHKEFLFESRLQSVREGRPTCSVFAFSENQEGNLWLGVEGIGLVDYNPQTEAFQVYDHCTADQSGLNENRIRSIVDAHNGTLWLGSRWGFSSFDLETKTFTTYPLSFSGVVDQTRNPKIEFVPIRKLIMGKDATLWLASSVGLVRYNTEEESFKLYNKDLEPSNQILSNELVDIVRISEEEFWIAAYGQGLANVLLGKDNEPFFINYTKTAEERSIPFDQIRQLALDEQGNLFFASNTELGSVSLECSEFTYYPEIRDYVDEQINSMTIDHLNRVWLGTIVGLYCFDPATKKIDFFDYRQGLQGKIFNFRSVGKLANGNLLFGGTNGYSVIYPDSIFLERSSPKVRVTDLLVMNERVLPGRLSDDWQEPALDSVINDQSTITLWSGAPIFSLKFSTVDPTKAQKVNYAYRLLGFDDQWLRVGRNPIATFTNLEPGEYTFEVTTVQQDGRLSEEITPLTLYIQPLFWQTNWFFWLGMITTLFTLLVIWQFRRRRSEVARSRLESLVDARTASLAKVSNFEKEARRQAEFAKQKA